ncbi:MAG: NAD(P)H-quinone dehydrogenase [Actinomycetota bacterium]
MHIAIIGGGPGGYEAALVAAELGAEVTLVDRDGLGGACVLWDCVPSKALASTAESLGGLEHASAMGLLLDEVPKIDFPAVAKRITALAQAQSSDIEAKVRASGVKLISGTARFKGPFQLEVDEETIDFDIAVIATGSRPRELAAAKPDGQRILNARQVYDIGQAPERLVIVGSGATGAEFACAFNRFGVEVTLVSSRDRVLPSEDEDAAKVLEAVFERRGIKIIKRARANAAVANGRGASVSLADGSTVEGTHALFTIGQIPNSSELNLEAAGVETTEAGAVPVDGVSRTNIRHIYAAGDVTGGVMLASTAAMQGRIAIWHAMGQAVSPLRKDAIAATVFTDPEIATVGLSEPAARERGLQTECIFQPLDTNARAKMGDLRDGFVKVLCLPGSGTVVGGTVVSPHASDLVLPLSVAVHSRLNVSQLAQAFSIYPSLGGSVQEAARRLMGR